MWRMSWAGRCDEGTVEQQAGVVGSSGAIDALFYRINVSTLFVMLGSLAYRCADLEEQSSMQCLV